MNIVDFWEEESAVTPKHHERILVVDDELDVREGLATLLEMEGYKVTMAENGAAALERAKAARFDVVLTDLRMPGLSGVETLMGLKKLQPALQVIVVTGFVSEATATHCQREGAFGIVTKPFDLDQLFDVIEKALEASKSPGPLPT